MTITKMSIGGAEIALAESREPLITDVQSALDFMMTVQFETGCRRIAVGKEALCEDFFILSTRLAGEVLQKFVNYRIKLAVYGDFSGYTSKPLKDFFYESNRGENFFFVATQEEALRLLAGTARA